MSCVLLIDVVVIRFLFVVFELDFCMLLDYLAYLP